MFSKEISGFLVCLAFVPYLCQADIRITNKPHGGGQLEVNEHSSLTIECESTTDHVSWSHNDVKIMNNSERFRIHEQQGSGSVKLYSSSLQIVHAEPDDAGNYACYCSHDNLKDEVGVKVKGHQHHSHVRIEGPSRVELSKGQELQLVCKADIHSDAQWKAGGKRIMESTRDKITVSDDEQNHIKTIVLIRKNLEAGDVGQYVCSNINEESDKATVEVRLVGSDSSAASFRMYATQLFGTVVTIALSVITTANFQL